MIDLKIVAKAYSAEEVVDAVYFAMRYVKQGAVARRTGKDIFQDAVRSSPTPRVRELTMALVKEIEGELGRSAADFAAGEFKAAMDSLAALAREHRGTMSDADRATAEALAAELSSDPLAASK